MRIGSIYSVGLKTYRAKCNKCGKRFEHGPEYGYRIREKYYCSYKCMRTAAGKTKPKDDRGGFYLSDEEKDEIVRLYDAGMSLREIMKATGRSNTSVTKVILDRHEQFIPVQTRRKEMHS